MSEYWTVEMPANWTPGNCPECTKKQWCKFWDAKYQTDPNACLFGSAELTTLKTLEKAMSDRSYRMEPR